MSNKLDTYDDKLCKLVAKVGIEEAYATLMPSVDRPMDHFKNKLHSGRFRNRLSELLDMSGLSLIHCNSKLKQLTEASKPIIIKNGDESRVEMFPDNNVQLGAVQTAYKLHKVLDKESVLNLDARRIELNIDQAGIDRLGAIVNEMNELNTNMDLNKHKVKVIDAESSST